MLDATASELAESLAVLRAQIEGEQRRMKALALLHKTREEARTEMMIPVAALVERIGTDYLEEICGKPIAEIRLTQSLAAERVIPSALLIPRSRIIPNNGDIFDLPRLPMLVGGTAWVFSKEEAKGQFDYLFIDEAGQVSVANLVGLAPAARSIVLLGDSDAVEPADSRRGPG